ncbi:RNA-binding domain-containing protein [Phocaeicola vulgatus]|jgi:ATP-dependent DNA helicase RecG|uniref:Winged helix-turn-helix transcriptional regulator n=1 Tax=Phocaeicola vulgatus TaxID=821 RepID=A0A415DEC2_PHOVU|nr:RNA-binding domain-containing protein [Phocaeicola vulgatus]RHJ74072.1 winged helix-turn-helix transcriptional regulator [Phocaeicola vulgatus]
MEQERFKEILEIGETIRVEFKRCGNGIESDTYETVCSFLNRFGGDIFLGVTDSGRVVGVPENSVSSIIKNFISCVSNPDLITPTVYLEPRPLHYEGKTVIHIHINPSAEVHSYKKEIFDRVDDADVHVTGTSQIAMMYIRKQSIFTERKVFPHIKVEDLRLDLLPTIRRMAVNSANGRHIWQKTDDMELLRSAGLFGTNHETGRHGLNLAAILLLGRDDVIKDVAPAYETDALLRRINIDRYDDREIVCTNLVESYDLLMEFAQKHLPDPFYLENEQRISLRGVICREMVSNMLIHREFSSSYPAKFVIENNRIYTENANRASWSGEITPENFEPNPKNPIIASFFRNIGLADKLGSGVRNIFKYAKYYQGGHPHFFEQDVFRTSVEFESTTIKVGNATINATISDTDATINATISEEDLQMLRLIQAKPDITYTELSEQLDLHRATVARRIKSLAKKRVISRIGARKTGVWIINISL